MKLLIITLLSLLLGNNAHASAFWQCKVTAVLKAETAPHQYKAKIIDAVTTGGQMGPGKACPSLENGKSVPIHLKDIDDLPLEQELVLKYKYESYRTQTEAKTISEWSLWEEEE